MKDPHWESLVRLLHIQEAVIKIEKYVQHETIDSFCEKDLLHDAVLLQFIIIGEAIISVQEDLLTKYPYPWYKVRSFRNMIAHEYFNIKLNAVWKIIKENLPELKIRIETILKKEF